MRCKCIHYVQWKFWIVPSPKREQQVPEPDPMLARSTVFHLHSKATQSRGQHLEHCDTMRPIPQWIPQGIPQGIPHVFSSYNRILILSFWFRTHDLEHLNGGTYERFKLFLQHVHIQKEKTCLSVAKSFREPKLQSESSRLCDAMGCQTLVWQVCTVGILKVCHLELCLGSTPLYSLASLCI